MDCEDDVELHESDNPEVSFIIGAAARFSECNRTCQIALCDLCVRPTAR